MRRSRTPLRRRRRPAAGGRAPVDGGARRRGDRGAAARSARTRRPPSTRLCAGRRRRRRADRAGRHRQDVHPRHRPRRLRTGRVAGDRRRPVSPGRAGADRRRRHPGPHPARPARRRRPRLRASSTAAPCSSSTKPGWPTSAPSNRSSPPPSGRGGRVLLVGDQHQMPSVGAGGGFAYAAEHGRHRRPLTVNRRQRERVGAARRSPRCATAASPTPSTPTASTAGSIVTADADTMIADAIARWTAAIDAGLQPVMLAGSNDLVDRLNRAAIDVLAERGLLPAADAAYGDDRYRVGARVTLRRNSQQRTHRRRGQRSTSPTASSAPSSPSTAAGSPSASTGNPTSTSSWTSATWPVAARSATATPSPPTAPKAAPGTCRSPSASTASTGKPPTPTCPAASPRTG